MASERTLERVSTTLVLLWIVPGLLLLCIVAGMIIGRTNYSLGLGLIHTRGLTGLMFTLLPALWGAGAVLLLFRNKPLGARMLLVYCLFWFLNFVGGLISNWDQLILSGGIFNGPVSLRVGVGLMIVTFLGSFLLCALWAWRRARMPRPKAVKAS